MGDRSVTVNETRGARENHGVCIFPDTGEGKKKEVCARKRVSRISNLILRRRLNLSSRHKYRP